MLVDLTSQIAHHLVSQKDHQSNWSSQKQLDQND
jgi:hypothetical protein